LRLRLRKGGVEMDKKNFDGLVKKIEGMSSEELKELLKEEGVLNRLKELRGNSGGMKMNGYEVKKGGDGKCVRCNRGFVDKRGNEGKWVEIDGLKFGVECGVIYMKEVSEGRYDKGEGKKCSDEFQKMMREKMKNLWLGM
jgi:hypothetical protein